MDFIFHGTVPHIDLARIKTDTPFEQLCANTGFLDECVTYFTHVRRQQFGQRPNYEMLQGHLTKAILKHKVDVPDDGITTKLESSDLKWPSSEWMPDCWFFLAALALAGLLTLACRHRCARVEEEEQTEYESDEYDKIENSLNHLDHEDIESFMADSDS